MNNKKIIINDVTLRDGMHAISHQYSADQIAELTRLIDESGADIIEATHGDGLGGSSIQYGFSKESEETIIRTAVENAKNAKIGVLLIPGIGTIEHLKRAHDYGAKVVRIATHCTEADISEQHIKYARDLGMDVVGFLMMSHMIPENELVEQAKKMEAYGAECVYCTDSAGALLMDDVRRRIAAFKEQLSVEVGFHAHNNLSLAVANSIVAIEEGADRIDSSLAGMGAGAGNTATEQLVAVMNKANISHNIDLYKTMDAAENVMKPMMPRPVQIDRLSLTMGYAGVYSSFLLFAFRTAEEYGIDARDILMEVGRQKAVGGQEDIILSVAQKLAKEKQSC
ncbi:4-hydroxy-2-oxovalerate aldolase [bacterium LRH843]|nr:4-hydroxy-2-oxovalerate aldolase [bacterium LRH843]